MNNNIDNRNLRGVVIPNFSNNEFTKDNIYNIIAVLGFKYVEVKSNLGETVVIDIDDKRYKIIL